MVVVDNIVNILKKDKLTGTEESISIVEERSRWIYLLKEIETANHFLFDCCSLSKMLFAEEWVFFLFKLYYFVNEVLISFVLSTSNQLSVWKELPSKWLDFKVKFKYAFNEFTTSIKSI